MAVGSDVTDDIKQAQYSSHRPDYNPKLCPARHGKQYQAAVSFCEILCPERWLQCQLSGRIFKAPLSLWLCTNIDIRMYG